MEEDMKVAVTVDEAVVAPEEQTVSCDCCKTNAGPREIMDKPLPEFPESYTEAEVADMIAKVNVDIVTDYFLIKPLKLNTHVITMSDGSSKETLFGYQRGVVIGKGCYEYVNGPGDSSHNVKFDRINIGDTVYFQVYSDAFDEENSMCDALLLDAYRVKAVEKKV